MALAIFSSESSAYTLVSPSGVTLRWCTAGKGHCIKIPVNIYRRAFPAGCRCIGLCKMPVNKKFLITALLLLRIDRQTVFAPNTPEMSTAITQPQTIKKYSFCPDSF